MGMKVLPVHEAVGKVLGHDLTRIVAGKCKGPAFRRGHVVKGEDLPLLLDIGKVNLHVYDPQDGYVHEDEAAYRIASAAAGPGIGLSEPVEGKITLAALYDGLLAIDLENLNRLNSLPDMVFSTIHRNQLVQKGRALAGTRVVPLVVPEELLVKAEAVCASAGSLIQVKPLKSFNVGLITTGSEILQGRIEDTFGPVVRSKFEELGSRIMGQVLVGDDRNRTVQAIRDFLSQGADFIALTGGMSVDPDDQTPAAIRASGARVVAYGAPVLPGAMFMLAYMDQVPILGLPGCVMYYKSSIFDLIAPRIMAGEEILKEDIASLGHGGYCEGCPTCRYPVCGFGKGA